MPEELHIHGFINERDRPEDVLREVVSAINWGIREQVIEVGQSKVRFSLRPIAAEAACDEPPELGRR